MSGLGDKLKGSAKEAAGNITGNDKLKLEGKKDQVVGDIKNKADDAKEAVSERMDGTRDDDKGEITPQP